MVSRDPHPEDRPALRPGVKHSSAAGGDGDRLIDAVITLLTAATAIIALAVIAAITLIVAVIAIVTAVMFAIRTTEGDLHDDSCHIVGRRGFTRKHGLGLRPQGKGDQGSTDKGQYLFHNVVYKVPDLNLS